MIITNTNSLQVFDAILRTDNTYASSEITISLIEEGSSVVTELTPTALVYSNNSVEVSYSISTGELIDGKTYLLTLKDSIGKLLFRDKLQVKDEYTTDNAAERFNMHDTDFVYIQDTNTSNYITVDTSLSGDKNFIHNQASASTSWSVSHGLGKFPSITVVDSGNSVVVGEVTFIDTNNLTINFAYSFSGKAYFN
jgi:hypothetical protein